MINKGISLIVIFLMAIGCSNSNKDPFKGKEVDNIIIDRYTCEQLDIEPRHFTITYPNDYGKQTSEKGNYLDFDNDEETLQIGSLTLDIEKVSLSVLDKQVDFDIENDKVSNLVYNETIGLQHQILEPTINKAVLAFYNSGAEVSIYSKSKPKTILLKGIKSGYGEVVFRIKHKEGVVFQQFSVICVPNLNNLKESLFCMVQLRLRDEKFGVDKIKESTAFKIMESIEFLD